MPRNARPCGAGQAGVPTQHGRWQCPASSSRKRPIGMPPFATGLSDEELAQLLTFIRASWSDRAQAVSALEAIRYRSAR